MANIGKDKKKIKEEFNKILSWFDRGKLILRTGPLKDCKVSLLGKEHDLPFAVGDTSIIRVSFIRAWGTIHFACCWWYCNWFLSWFYILQAVFTYKEIDWFINWTLKLETLKLDTRTYNHSFHSPWVYAPFIHMSDTTITTRDHYFLYDSRAFKSKQ